MATETIEEVVYSGKMLLKGVKPVSRNDGNIIQMTLHCSFSTEEFATLGSLFDQEVHVEISPMQFEFDSGDGVEVEAE